MRRLNLTAGTSMIASEGFWGRQVQAEIDLSAISDNVRALKRLIGPTCRIMAVVKANGYGLGAPWVASAALEGGASMLAVACVDEGIELRRAGYTGPVLVMSYIPPEEADAAVRNNLTVVLHRPRTALALEGAARRAGLPLGSVVVHIKVDTGLGRFGCLPSEFLPLAQLVRGCPHLRLEGLMTHFADADATDLSFARLQLSRFHEVLGEASENGITFSMVHAANSAAALALPEARFDMVRTGIMLSGYLPAPRFEGAIRLRRAVTVHTRLARVYPAQPGESVGYGRTWKAERPATIGLIPMGYADGFRRALSNRGEVLVRGQRCPIVGIVSMDQCSVDVTHVNGVAEGDEVVVIGKQGGDEITADDVARRLGTISYEVLCGLSERVPRYYFRHGEPVEVCNLVGSSPARERPRPKKELTR